MREDHDQRITEALRLIRDDMRPERDKLLVSVFGLPADGGELVQFRIARNANSMESRLELALARARKYRAAILELDEKASIDGRCHFCEVDVVDNDHGPGCIVSFAEEDE